jgi:small-conductance mechanosensitive channel
MDAFWTTVTDSLHQLITPERLASTARAAIFLVVGFLLAKLAARGLERVLRRTLEPTQAFLARRIVNYVLLALVVASVLVEMGFDLSVLLGAAGVLTVALGFASQTSASNLISGLFLVVERPFAIGDTVRIGNHTGEVLAIDLLSTKLRTFDNLFVRVPNESVMKGEVINFTRFPIRRIDLQIQVAYKEDQKRVREILTEVVDANPRCLEEPRPQIFFKDFADSGVNLQLSFWTAQGNYIEVKNTLPGVLLDRLREADIEIPFPHRKILQDPAPTPTDR